MCHKGLLFFCQSDRDVSCSLADEKGLGLLDFSRSLGAGAISGVAAALEGHSYVKPAGEAAEQHQFYTINTA